MSGGETKASVSAWTIDSLREHLAALLAESDKRYGQRFDAQQEALADAMASAKEAVTKAESAADKRAESQNEFRSQLKDQASTFISRTEADARFAALSEKIDMVRERNVLLEKQLVELRSSGDGRRAGVGQVWGVIVGAVGVAGGVVATAVALLRR